MQQKTKDNKWVCRMCGGKQSTRKIFAAGTGKDCRAAVQQLNMSRVLGESKAPPEGEAAEAWDGGEAHVEFVDPAHSKWRAFAEDEGEDGEETEEVVSCGMAYAGERQRETERLRDREKE